MHYDSDTAVCSLSNGVQDTPLWQFFGVAFIYVTPLYSERACIDKLHGSYQGICLPKNEDIIDTKYQWKSELI